MTIAAYLPYYVLAGSLGVLAALLLGLGQILRDAHWPERDHNRTLWATGTVLVGWFAVATILARLNVYQVTSDRLPTIQYGIAVPLLIGGILLWRSSTVSRLIDLTPQRWIVGVQLYRVLGVIFLILYSSGGLPGLFAWPAGVGDLAVGLLAPVVAWSAVHEQHTRSRTVWLWNLFGIADLSVAILAGFLTSASALELSAFDPSNELIAAFPLVLIPTFMVPLSFVFHLISLIKLGRARTSHKVSGSLMKEPGILDANKHSLETMPSGLRGRASAG